LTTDVIRATARLIQLRPRVTDADAGALVKEAEAVRYTVAIVEIDPREESGVIPNDSEAFMQPLGKPNTAVHGPLTPQLRDVRALAGILQRNYDYDRFWITFPLKRADGTPLFSTNDPMRSLSCCGFTTKRGRARVVVAMPVIVCGTRRI